MNWYLVLTLILLWSFIYLKEKRKFKIVGFTLEVLIIMMTVFILETLISYIPISIPNNYVMWIGGMIIFSYVTFLSFRSWKTNGKE